MVFGFGGIPLLYMGDEIGMFNDYSFVDDPEKAEDNRWIHRPKMDWSAAELARTAKNKTSVAARIYSGISQITSARKQSPALHASVTTKVRAGRGSGVAIFERNHPAGQMIQVYNLSEDSRWVSQDELGDLSGKIEDRLTGEVFELREGITLSPYAALWLVKS
jgi:amylosucrase